MVKYPTLKNAPITEAILDIRVNLPDTTTLKTLERFQEKIKQQFPERKTRTQIEGIFQINSKDASSRMSTSSQQNGFLFKSKESNKIVQARLDGFTFNKLKPYENWDKFSGEAQLLWKHYLSIARPVNVKRIALRYINKIEMPLPIKDFRDYILTSPEIAPGLSQKLAGYFFRLVQPYPEKQINAIITEALEQPTQDNKYLPVIFDIDVYKEIILEPKDPKIWEILNDLREIKNDIFFKSITIKARKLFD